MDQACERHPPILDRPSASIEEVVNPLDSPIQLRDPNPEPNPVHQPEDITDGERTPTGDPARNQDPSTTVPPPGMTPALDLASALALLAQSMAKSNSTPVPTAPSSGSKVREPDQFDGSDPRKLRLFLFQCQLNFHDHPAAFATDLAKVNYTVSFLSGTALDYFEPGLSTEREPEWLSNFSSFWSENSRPTLALTTHLVTRKPNWSSW